MIDFKEIIDECVAQKDFYNADRMKQVYLEYRRVNGIFEVGDMVVFRIVERRVIHFILVPLRI